MTGAATVASLFPFDRIAPGRLASIESESIGRIKDELRRMAPGVPWPKVARSIQDQLPAAFNSGLREIIEDACAGIFVARSDALQIEGVQRPGLDVLAAGQFVGTLELRVSLTLSLGRVRIEATDSLDRCLHVDGPALFSGEISCDGVALLAVSERSFAAPRALLLRGTQAPAKPLPGEDSASAPDRPGAEPPVPG
ncbi:MAG TPA: hypothetical protein VHA82_09670 [Ramlibacter sp.]|uniref:hypothetical protein n=1 Tax=Ramlibacter sp. TaxID=1917967 RepID=UPI002BBCD29D|nr:hypothetical protein [Ramlibacter sp.]HVZ44068.1 hypothetical protein [Ramlibacter sp.]